jgi:hypothetical protein
VNVGRRQEGRDRDPNVIDAPAEEAAIAAAIARARSTAFRDALRPGSRLGDGRAANRIVEVIRTLRIDERLLRKQIAY